MLKSISLFFFFLLVGSTYGRVNPHLSEDTGVCKTCLMSVRVVEDLLCDSAVTDYVIKIAKTQICPSMPDVDVEQCKELAEGLIPTLIEWFRSSATPASLCSSIDVCGAEVLSLKNLNRAPLHVKDGSECAMCQFVVTQMKFALNSSNAISEIEKDGVKACQTLPPLLAKPCIELVVDNVNVISRFISTVTPVQLCSLVGACPATAAATIRPRPLPASLFTAFSRASSQRIGERQQANLANALMSLKDERLRISASMGEPVATNQMCSFCEMAVIEAKNIISYPAFQQQVLNYTISLCEQVPSYEAVCDFYMQQYVPIFFALVEQYLVPDVLCGEVGLCPVTGLYAITGGMEALVASFLQRMADLLARNAGQHMVSIRQ